MPPTPWPKVDVARDTFQNPPREYGILPFWFLNGELDPDEMRYQLRELRDKGMPGIILHGRFGLELPYLGEAFRDRIALAVEEAAGLGLTTWIYDEMNWPSGTADLAVLRVRPDLAQRYLECLSFPIRGPWFAYLTGGDSRYIDFERSTPVAAFAVSEDGAVVDLTPNLSFENVIPWEVPAGNWRLMYIVEKRAEYYIDALDPEATREFLRLGYEPYIEPAGDELARSMVGFYTDEPAMHYYVTGGENPIVPWTKDMFRRFHVRHGYSLRARLPDLYFELSPDSARVRHDFYTTLTAFYSDAYYRQIHEWCREHDVLFTGHLLYEENLRKMVRVEGNPFSHYRHMDVIGVDHLYPIIGDRDRPSEHVAMKLASSAAHQLGSERLLCESFGGIFMDATMQRMKWLTDWQYVLGVNLLNPHGFHYTLEGPRKRDWPPSMFYQYPWWHYYAEFSAYVSRLSHMLTGGRHAAKVAVLWPINDIFGTYTPQHRSALANRTERDFDTLTDMLLRLHLDFDYLDEDMLAGADLDGRSIRVREEAYELLILPPMKYLKLETVERLEGFVAAGGRVLGMVYLPDTAYGTGELIDISDRISALFGVDPAATQRDHATVAGFDVRLTEHAGGGKATFLRTHALNRRLPRRLQERIGAIGQPESGNVVIEEVDGQTSYWFIDADGEREEITGEVVTEREEALRVLAGAITALIEPAILIDNAEVFSLHRVKDGRDLFFIVNPTFVPQSAKVTLMAECRPVLWDPSTGEERPIAPWDVRDGRTTFQLVLPATGSAFVLTEAPAPIRVVEAGAVVTAIDGTRVQGYASGAGGRIALSSDPSNPIVVGSGREPVTIALDGPWEFVPEDDNALVIARWLASDRSLSAEEALAADGDGWLEMIPGAWSYQLPAEPAEPYPINTWYRLTFDAGFVPPVLDLIIDGFAGSGWRVLVNGEAVSAAPERSRIDSQMQRLDIAPQVQTGHNVVLIEITVTSATDGLLDLVKLMGHFSLEQHGEGWRIARPAPRLDPSSWVGQGYPFYSGRGVYRRVFDMPDGIGERRVILHPRMRDDVVEVTVNGQPAGVRLWAPYDIDISHLAHPGENLLELRVANTLINLLEAVQRPSGLDGSPTIGLYETFELKLPGAP